jgi:K+-transporting ATPase ATPase C chain
MKQELRPALVVFAALTVATGVAYPALVTGLAAMLFPRQAGGSLVIEGGRVRGSRLIGQVFSDSGHFWSRPSATTPAYNASSSSGSNLGPLNPALAQAVKNRVAALHAADPGNTAPVPVDLVTASGSGLDPEISPAAAEYQVARVARVRGALAETVRAAVARHTAGRTFGVLGEARVNVLLLNLDLDRTLPSRAGVATR